MCTTCGCSDTASPRVTNLETGQTNSLVSQHHSHVHGEHDHVHDHHSHGDLHSHDHEHTVLIEEAILSKNDRLAAKNREWFEEKNIFALNLVSSPGSGKTTLLEHTIRDLHDSMAISVVEGDQETLHDAERIQRTGCRVVQINTGAGCHLEADMLARGLEELRPPSHSLVFIENVGNLVCPALFDLGEQSKVAILSTTEGEDKPLKYPHMFQSSAVMILNKIDLLPYLTFDVSKCLEYAKMVNPHLLVFQVSATTGEGLQQWYDWIRAQMKPNFDNDTALRYSRFK
ncbi:hydrogenase nickel incorporation protein HypB [Candidatus Nitrospira salsa]